MTKKNELYHFGIKGQKWGLRRYQNPDGTLTEEGKKRYYAYKQSNSLRNKMYSESRKLIKSDKRLIRDFGIGTDDEELLIQVSNQYKINNKDLKESVKTFYDFNSENYEYIKAGRKIAKKLLKEKVY